MAAVAMVMNPGYTVDPDSTVALAVARAKLFVNQSSGVAGAGTPADRFRRNRDLAAAMPFRCETPDGIRAAVLRSPAIWSDADVLDAYRVLRRSLQFLEGRRKRMVLWRCSVRCTGCAARSLHRRRCRIHASPRR